MLRSKYHALGLLLVLAFVFALVPAVAFAAPTRGVTGVIKDATTGYPIPFAQAILSDSGGVEIDWAQAAYDGTYSFEAEVGTYTVYAALKSYVGSTTPEFRVEAGAATTENLVLDRWVNFSQPIYRFFNMTGGVHFYTADNSEFINVYKSLPTYKYDGIGYWVPEGDSISPYADGADGEGLMNMNDVVLQRFYNKQTGVHFYTADSVEYLNVKNNLSAIYKYDGPAYNVRLDEGYGLPIFRFYNGTTNAHFYTANLSEINGEYTASLAGTYKFEGTAFYTGDWDDTFSLQYNVAELTDGTIEAGTIVPADDTVGFIDGSTRQTVVAGGYGTSVTASAATGYTFVGWLPVQVPAVADPTREDGPIQVPTTYTAVFQVTP
ncbi:MAG: carboxypeptidase regulatory-like domain-containing protein [Coriobacteriia bacterium]